MGAFKSAIRICDSEENVLSVYHISQHFNSVILMLKKLFITWYIITVNIQLCTHQKAVHRFFLTKDLSGISNGSVHAQKFIRSRVLLGICFQFVKKSVERRQIDLKKVYQLLLKCNLRQLGCFLSIIHKAPDSMFIWENVQSATQIHKFCLQKIGYHYYSTQHIEMEV